MSESVSRKMLAFGSILDNPFHNLSSIVELLLTASMVILVSF